MRSYKRRLLLAALLFMTGFLAHKYRDGVDHITSTLYHLSAVQVFNASLNHTTYIPPSGTRKNANHSSKAEVLHVLSTSRRNATLVSPKTEIRHQPNIRMNVTHLPETKVPKHEANNGPKEELINKSVVLNLDCISNKPRDVNYRMSDRSIHRGAKDNTFLPPLKSVDNIVMNTLKNLPVETIHQFCENLLQLADDKKFIYWQLPTVERWYVALRTFSSVGLKQRLPDVLGIGVKKSGTNAVVHFLKQHPLIKVPYDATEAHYFDKHYSSGIQFYKANMPLVYKSQLCFEKTPRYFVTESAPGNIAKDIIPAPKFLLCVRDPAKRALSDWRHEAVIKAMKVRRSSSETQTAQSEGRLFAREVIRGDGTVNPASDFIRTSTYDIHFEKWLKYFSREQFLILKEEDISSDPYKEMKRIEEFLGLESFFEKDIFVYRERQKGMCFVHGNHKEDCPPRYGVKIPHPSPNEGVIQKMRDFFRPHNKRFEDMSGMKFQWSDL